jgi:hypothetical protein
MSRKTIGGQIFTFYLASSNFYTSGTKTKNKNLALQIGYEYQMGQV